jgi:glycosyltransferase domain-containing protein
MRTVVRVSIGIPVYNGERYLADCLDSLLGQTFADFEILVSDNCSTDATREICLDYARRDARVRYSRTERNIGHFGNHTRVAEQARAQYFRWMAYDDLCAPSHLERCVAALDGSPAAALAYTRTVFFEEREGAVVEIHPSRYKDDHVALPMASPVRRLQRLVQNLNYCNALYGVIRTDVLRTTSLIKAIYGADRVLLAELASKGTFIEIDEPLFLRRVHPGQTYHRDSHLRLLGEHARVIREGPLTPGERALGLATVLPLLVWKRRRRLAIELLRRSPRTYSLARRTTRHFRGLAI